MAGNDLLTRLIFEAEDRASSVITKIGTALATYFAVDKISGFFSSAVKGASDLEKQFSTLQAATGATGEDIAKLKAKAEELGASDALSVSALQAAQAMTELGRAGQSTEQILQSITPVIALAQGASLDLGEAANIVTANLAGFQLSADQAGRVADVLSTAASSAKTTVRQLADALSYAAPAANAAGMSIEETTAIIAKMQNAGIDGTRAGTALNAMLTSLADPASTASKALDQAGISTRSFSEVLAKLEQGGPAAKEAIVAFGTEAGPALRALLAQGSASIQELKTSLENASGSAEKAAATMNDNLAGAFEALGSVWDGLKTSLVQPLLEPLEQQARSLAASLANFSQSAQMEQLKAVLVSTFETGAAQLRAFASAINWPAFAQSVSDGLNSALTSIKSWAENIGTVKDSVVLAFSAIGTGISTVQAAFFGLAGAAATAISAMLEGFAWLREQAANVAFGPLKTMLEDSAANYRAVAESFRVSAEENFGKASEALAQAAERGETLREAWSRLNEPAQQVAANVSALGTAQEGTTQKSAELIEAERELELALAAYNAALAQAQAGQDTTGTSLIALGQAVIAAQDKVNALTSAATQAAPALDAVGQAATATGTSAEQASQQIAELENAYQAFLAIGDTQSAAQIRQQIEDIRDSLQQVPDASEAAASAFRTLNITSQSELRRIAETAKSAFETIERSGTAAPEDIKNAFKAYATAAIAANNGVADSTIKTKAAQLGLAVVATETGDKIVTASEAAAQSVYEVAQAAAAAQEALAEMGEATEGAAEGTEEVGEAAESAGSILDYFYQMIFDAIDELRAYSEAAADAVSSIFFSSTAFLDKIWLISELTKDPSLFDTSSIANYKREIASLSEKAKELESQINALDLAAFEDFDYGPFYEMTKAIKEVTLAAVEAKIEAARTAIAIEELGTALDRLNRYYRSGDVSLSEYIKELERLQWKYHELSEDDLANLTEALAEARAEQEALTASALEGLESWRAKLYQIKGQQIELQKLNWQSDKAKVEKELAEARRNNNKEQIAALEEQLKLIDEYYQIKVKQAEESEAKAAKEKAEAEAKAAQEKAEAEAKAAQEKAEAVAKAAAEEAKARDSALKSLESWREKLYQIEGQQTELQKLNWEADKLATEEALAKAKRNNNKEQIAALEEQLKLIDKYYKIKTEEAEKSEKEAKAAKEKAEAEAKAAKEKAEAEAKAAVTKKKAETETKTKQRTSEQECSTLAPKDIKRSIEITSPITAMPATTSAAVTTVRTVNINIRTPTGDSGTVRVLEGDDATLERLLRSLELGQAVT